MAILCLTMETKTTSEKWNHNIMLRRIPPQNVILRLRKREIFGSVKPATHFHVARQFHQNVFPNFTIINVQKPPCFLRKFSPDGRHFIAFSSDQTAVEIYIYMGPAAAGDLLQHKINCDFIGNRLDRRSEWIRCNVFERFFRLKHTVKVANNNEQLNRECSLFTDNGRYVIVGSAVYIPDEQRPPFHQLYNHNEGVTTDYRCPLEDYSLHIIDLKKGQLCDTKTFKCDKIVLSHNQGLYLYKDVLAVLSVLHQYIHLFHIIDGTFNTVHTIGRFCFEDDHLFFTSVYPSRASSAFKEVAISSMKHKMLTFLFSRAKRLSDITGNAFELRKFYQYFEKFRALRMWRMQLLDENHLLIKYASEEIVTQRVEANTHASFFVIYNISSAKVLAVYENTSEEFLQLFEQFCDLFRNAKLHSESQFTCSPSNNIYARLIQQRFKQTIVSARYGGVTEATKRLLSQLPISAQSYSSSPYLDLSLFSYDDKWVSVMERPKTCGEYPIRFYGRDSGLLKFRIFPGWNEANPSSSRRLVAFTFHPTDPFAISVQRTNSDYIVNFHVRHNF